MTQHIVTTAFGQNHQHIHSPQEEEGETLPSLSAPLIFDAHFLEESIPSGFNAVRIPLNAAMKSDLNWDQEYQAAERYTQQGLHIFWDMDLGLFSRLPFPLVHQQQFLSLTLALEHFRDTLWKKFKQHTIGVCLYRGSADFHSTFLCNEELLSAIQEWIKEVFTDPETFAAETQQIITDFSQITFSSLSSTPEGLHLLRLYCRDAAGTYLDFLADCLPDTLPCYALLDTSMLADPLLQGQLTTKERFPAINLGVKGSCFHDYALAWDGPAKELGCLARELHSFPTAEEIRVGICLPSIEEYFPSKWKKFGSVFSLAKEKNIPIRAIPEASLTTDWDGLDYIIASKQHLSIQGRRKLQGFCAAGGIVAVIDDPIGLPGEISIDEIL